VNISSPGRRHAKWAVLIKSTAVSSWATHRSEGPMSVTGNIPKNPPLKTPHNGRGSSNAESPSLASTLVNNRYNINRSRETGNQIVLKQANQA
jgi:hypothetical protein